MSFARSHSTFRQTPQLIVAGEVMLSSAFNGLSIYKPDAYPSTAPRLPIELWQEIFEHGLPTITAGDIYSPLLVCRIWHAAAVSHTHLWSEIDLDEYALNDPRTAAKIKNWVRLSGTHRPLRVTVATVCPPKHPRYLKMFPWESDNHEGRIIFPVTETMTHNIYILAQSVKRWEVLGIYTTNYFLLQAILDEVADKAINVKRLRISTLLGSPSNLAISLPYAQIPYQDLDRASWITTFPNVQAVHIVARWSCCSIQMIPRLAGETVTVLIVSQAVLEPHSFLKLALQMPNLETLGFPDGRFRNFEQPRNWWDQLEERGVVPQGKSLCPKLKLLALETPVAIPGIVLGCGGPILEQVHLQCDPSMWRGDVAFADNLRRLPTTTKSLTIYCLLGDYGVFCGSLFDEVAEAFGSLKKLESVTFLPVGYQTTGDAWRLSPDISPLIDAALGQTRLVMEEARRKNLRPSVQITLKYGTFIRLHPDLDKEVKQAEVEGFVKTVICRHSGRDGYLWTLQ